MGFNSTLKSTCIVEYKFFFRVYLLTPGMHDNEFEVQAARPLVYAMLFPSISRQKWS